MVPGQKELPVDSDTPMSLSERPDPATESVLYPLQPEYSPALDSGIDGENPEGSGEKEKRPDMPTQKDEDESIGAMELCEEEDDHSRAPTTPPRQISSANFANRFPTSVGTEDKVIPTAITPERKEPESMDRILRKMCKVMRNIPKKATGSGFVYVFSHPTNGAAFYKIGQTQDPKFREKTHRDTCELSSWELHELPQFPFQEYSRVESLALSQLRNNGCDFECHCAKKHVEYLIGDKQNGLNTLKLWIDWLAREKPFDDDRRLTPFWEDRVNAIDIKSGDGRLRHLFHCHKAECIRRIPTRRDACQECLDAGWMRWTNPTAWEKFEYKMTCVFSTLMDYFNLVQNTIGWRLILCLILYCLPGPFHARLGIVQCLSFSVPTYLIHLGSRDNSKHKRRRPKITEWSPGLQQSPFTPMKFPLRGRLSLPSPTRLFFVARDVERGTPPTTDITQLTPQSIDHLSTSSPLTTPSPALRSRKGSKRLDQQDRAATAPVLFNTECSSI
ncbi:hypothetical protein PHISCL_02677 [Aspergillus sclerotialis]|uniref:Bacteriophage T5 Orf172 DNA-binding domain-containing protein n=1 Tax=Aspergillus sclerotialis TaxID=2070753 RepID=A0A3A2ZPT1_9EURO|nr:hypothetical protein PHISCL_02677 [Aspergillus sclerotialis]